MRRKRIHPSHLVAGFLITGAAIGICLLDAAPEATAGDEGPAALEEQIARATGLAVTPHSVVWPVGRPDAELEPAIRGLEVLFLAAEDEGSLADLYRAEVRVGPGPTLISQTGLANLTASPHGDDYIVRASPPFVVVATRALGQVRSLTIFDLKGQQLPRDGSWSSLQRAMARVTDLQRTSRPRGCGRVNVRFGRPPEDVALTFTEKARRKVLAVEWTDHLGKQQLAAVDAATGDSEHEDLQAVAEVRLPKRPILWLVDTVRAIPWIGPGPIEWAEGRFFALKDSFKRLLYSISENNFEEDEGAADQTAGQAPAVTYALPAGLEIGASNPEVTWPPAPLKPPVFSRKRAGEGVWTPAAPKFVRTIPGAPPAVFRTFVRADERRPYTHVELLAMDMRQLELHMVAGHEDPQSTTGARGTGKIPRDREILPRVVAVFNGAFKTEHGAYGMMVDRTVLLPPQDDAATVATMADGTMAMGSWPKGLEIPDAMRSFRQNMDPMVEDGTVNPRRRWLWGFTIDNDIHNMNTVRSGICMTADGNLIYAWGDDSTAKTLGVAMNAAGCVYGLHLDMNPYHCSYIFYRFEAVEDGKRPEYKAELANRDMGFNPSRFVFGAPKDFFFLTLRDSSPGPGWEANGLAQPAPAHVPAVFKRQQGAVELLIVDRQRSTVALTPGQVPEELAPAAAERAEDSDEGLLLELLLGPWAEDRGQLVRGAVVAVLETGAPTLALHADGALGIESWGELDPGATPVDDAVQGQWLLRDGEVAGPGIETRSAIGFVGDRWLVVGRGPAEELASAMKGSGVIDAVVFSSVESTDPWVLVRREQGMTDFAGQPVSERNVESAALLVTARTTHFGGVRLEEALRQVGVPTESTAAGR
jgi:hypothetical protein